MATVCNHHISTSESQRVLEARGIVQLQDAAHPAHQNQHYLFVLSLQVYGERSERHQEIMMMDADALHEAFPFTEELVFNEARCSWR